LIAFGQGVVGDLFVVRPDGTGLNRLTAAGDNELLGWAVGPVPRSAQRSAPLPATKAAAGLTLRSPGRVRELAAHGRWVAAVLARTGRDCDKVVAWMAGAARAVRFGNSRPCDGNEQLFGIGLTGTSATWSRFECGNDCYLTPICAETGRPGVERIGRTDDVGSGGRAPKRPLPPKETHNGIAFSMRRGVIRLRRVADGHEITIRPPTRTVDAELEDAGIFYAYNIPQSPLPGRIVFVPFAELAHRF